MFPLLFLALLPLFILMPFWLIQLQNLIQWVLDANGIPFNVACAIARAIISGIAASLGF